MLLLNIGATNGSSLIAIEVLSTTYDQAKRLNINVIRIIISKCLFYLYNN